MRSCYLQYDDVLDFLDDLLQPLPHARPHLAQLMRHDRRLTEDDIYQCGRCGEMWWQWEGHGPAGPSTHVLFCRDNEHQLELVGEGNA